MDLLLDKFASNVSTQMVKNAAIFTNPPFPIANLDAAQKAFHQADADASNLGKQLTAEKNTKREIVIALLRQLAAYIEAISGITPEQVMTPEVPAILNLFNAGSGSLGVKL
jgi:hypothetical protein